LAMDWPSVVHPYLTDQDLEDFVYDSPSQIKCRVVTHHTAIFQRDLKAGKGQDPDLSGFHVLSVTGQSSLPPQILLSDPSTGCQWGRVTQAFPVHNVVLRAMEEKTCYSTFLVKREASDILEMYTATTSSRRYSSMAISSTHFRRSKLTVAVVYGCDDEIMGKIEALLGGWPEVKNHPLLMMGIFAELQRDRIQILVRDITDSWLGLTIESRISPWDRRARPLTWDENQSLREHRHITDEVEDEVRVTKLQLQKTISQIDETVDGENNDATDVQDGREGGATDGFATSIRRFKRRFDEINMDIDDMMSKLRMTADDMIYTRELVYNTPPYLLLTFLLQLVAEIARREAKYSTGIAFIAMIYLPMTTVATILSMPVFSFQSDWKNAQFVSVGDNSSGSSNSASGGNTLGSNGPVFSGYFWIWLLFSGVLTACTIFIWWLATRGDGSSDDSLLSWLSSVISHGDNMGPEQDDEQDADARETDPLNRTGSHRSETVEGVLVPGNASAANETSNVTPPEKVSTREEISPPPRSACLKLLDFARGRKDKNEMV
ncbi:hypothetical protein QBC46DRAFT_268482, partial [Diplogelasinospora grovesii]